MELFLVLALCAACVYVLATEKLPVDMTAIFVAIVLIVTGLLTPEQGFSGLGNPATVTVAAMFVLSAGLAKTGALHVATAALTRLGKRLPWIAILCLMLTAGAASAFVNNTAVVALFLPVVLEVGRAANMSPSRLLMPLSFASMFGGVCTLVGSSTNILISSIAERSGIRPFQMFEFSELGLIMGAAGLFYMLAIGVRLIPDRRASSDLTELFGLGDYLTDAVLLPEAKSVGTIASVSALAKDLDVEILAIFRQGKLIDEPADRIVLQAHDVVRLRCDAQKIEKLQDRMGISLVSNLGWRDQDLEGGALELVEAVVAPNSVLSGQTLKSLRFTEAYGAKVLAIRHHGQLNQAKLDSAELRSGDTLLLSVRRDWLQALARNPAFVMVTPKAMPAYRRKKTLVAILILAAVIAASALNVVPIVVAALGGCAAMVFTGCLKREEIYPAIDWKVIVMLGGLLPLGLALETTGAAALLSKFVVTVFGPLGPWVLLSVLYLVTSLLTEIMSNSATAVLLTPIAISAAQAMNVDPRPFLIAVTFAASSSFMTPVGYQTNTLIYGPGAYRFADFLRVGAPLNVLYWTMATLLIPRYWPFHP
jgi:di/tricarboxylate transporter